MQEALSLILQANTNQKGVKQSARSAVSAGKSGVFHSSPVLSLLHYTEVFAKDISSCHQLYSSSEVLMMDVGKSENVMSRLLIDYWLRTKFSLLNVKSTALRVAILRWHKSFLNRTRPWFIINCSRTLSPDLEEEVLGCWIVLSAW